MRKPVKIDAARSTYYVVKKYETEVQEVLVTNVTAKSLVLIEKNRNGSEYGRRALMISEYETYFPSKLAALESIRARLDSNIEHYRTSLSLAVEARSKIDVELARIQGVPA